MNYFTEKDMISFAYWFCNRVHLGKETDTVEEEFKIWMTIVKEPELKTAAQFKAEQEKKIKEEIKAYEKELSEKRLRDTKNFFKYGTLPILAYFLWFCYMRSHGASETVMTLLCVGVIVLITGLFIITGLIDEIKEKIFKKEV